MLSRNFPCGASGSNYHVAVNAKGNTPAWKTIPIEECNEPLVPLGAFSEYRDIFTDSIYFGEGHGSPYRKGELEGALLTVFVRKGVAERLKRASEMLPEGFCFMAWDGYRPLSVQRALFEDYKRQLVQIGGMPEEEAVTAAQKFVSIPSIDPSCPSPHNTGGSIDLTIVQFPKGLWAQIKQLNRTIKEADERNDSQAVYEAEMARQALFHRSRPLDMGVAFDEVSERTATNWYEKFSAGLTLEKDAQILRNRRLLVNVMQAVGFVNYGEEIWHFDYGNQFAAERVDAPAIYGPAALTAGNLQHEQMRCGHYAGNLYLQNCRNVPHAIRLDESPPFNYVKRAAEMMGDIRSSFPQSERLTVVPR